MGGWEISCHVGAAHEVTVEFTQSALAAQTEPCTSMMLEKLPAN